MLSLLNATPTLSITHIQQSYPCHTTRRDSSPGGAGGELIVPDPVPLEIAARGWQAIVDPEAVNWQLHAALRTLAAASRAGASSLSRDLATGVEIVLDRAGQVNPLVASGGLMLVNDRSLRLQLR